MRVNRLTACKQCDRKQLWVHNARPAVTGHASPWRLLHDGRQCTITTAAIALPPPTAAVANCNQVVGRVAQIQNTANVTSW